MTEDDYTYPAGSAMKALPRGSAMAASAAENQSTTDHYRSSSPLNRSERPRSVEPRFSPSASFAYNARIGIALVPCAALLVEMGGIPVMATLAVGLMVSYILDSLDSLQLKQGAFFGIWSILLI